MFATRFRADQVDSTAFIAPNAVVLGDVHLGAESSVWFSAVVRGDTEQIRIGTRTNIQDLSVLHVDRNIPCRIGNAVTVGHGAIVHGAIVDDNCLIGMRAVLLNGVRIGEGSLIAAGAVIPEGTEIPPGSVVMGLPGKVRRETTPQERERIAQAAQHYVAATQEFRQEYA